MEGIISNWISSELIDSITYTVLQSVWQGAIIAMLTFVLFRWTADNPRVRYNLSLLGITALFLCSVITFLMSYTSGVSADITAVTATLSEWSNDMLVLDEHTMTLSNSWIGYLWILGVTIFSIKFLMDLGIVQYIRYTAHESEASKQYTPVLDAMQKKLNHSAKLKVSTIIQAPITIGFFKPIILFPVGMLTQLTLAEVESILRHEMAHIVRNDYFINILQSIMEIVLFYHPLVWWLSKVAREEREYCCDDAALTSNGEVLEYAKTLVHVQELAMRKRETLAMSFTDQSLMNRIKRIMNLPKSNRNMREKLIAITAVFVLLVFAGKDMIASVTDKIWNTIEIENSDIPREIVELEMDLMQIDTLPIKSRSSYSITKSDEEGSISIQKENGKITNLEIDGQKIPETDYDQYESEIQDLEGGSNRKGNTWFFSDGDRIDMENLEDELGRLGIEMKDLGQRFDGQFGENMEDWGERFGMSMQNLGEQLGDKFEWHFEEGDSARAFSFVMPEINGDMILELEDFMDGVDVDRLELDGMTDELSKMLEDLNLQELNLRELGDDRRFKENFFGPGRTVEDKIGYELRKDRLIATGEVSEVELSGKHMKINGDKQPKNIWNKYKEIFEETSGIELSKDSKLKFNVEGKKTIKKTRAF